MPDEFFVHVQFEEVGHDDCGGFEYVDQTGALLLDNADGSVIEEFPRLFGEDGAVLGMQRMLEDEYDYVVHCLDLDKTMFLTEGIDEDNRDCTTSKIDGELMLGGEERQMQMRDTFKAIHAKDNAFAVVVTANPNGGSALVTDLLNRVTPADAVIPRFTVRPAAHSRLRSMHTRVYPLAEELSDFYDPVTGFPTTRRLGRTSKLNVMRGDVLQYLGLPRRDDTVAVVLYDDSIGHFKYFTGRVPVTTSNKRSMDDESDYTGESESEYESEYESESGRKRARIEDNGNGSWTGWMRGLFGGAKAMKQTIRRIEEKSGQRRNDLRRQFNRMYIYENNHTS